jgi:hypothetical protein
MNNLEQERIEQQIEAQIALGARLIDVKNTQGWQDVVEILEQVKEAAKQDLLKCEPDKPETILALHAQARAADVVHALLLTAIEEAIQNAKALKQQQHHQQLADADTQL